MLTLWVLHIEMIKAIKGLLFHPFIISVSRQGWKLGKWRLCGGFSHQHSICAGAVL